MHLIFDEAQTRTGPYRRTLFASERDGIVPHLTLSKPLHRPAARGDARHREGEIDLGLEIFDKALAKALH